MAKRTNDPPVDQRFWAKVDKSTSPDGCWLWTGYRTPTGYGRFGYRTGEGMWPAHRAAYDLLVGPIPDGLQIDHICRVRACVRPDHLQLATYQQNGQNRTGNYEGATVGVRGVDLHKQSGKYRVRCFLDGVSYSGGYFTDLAEAEAAAVALRNRLMTNNLADREAS